MVWAAQRALSRRQALLLVEHRSESCRPGLVQKLVPLSVVTVQMQEDSEVKGVQTARLGCLVYFRWLWKPAKLRVLPVQMLIAREAAAPRPDGYMSDGRLV